MLKYPYYAHLQVNLFLKTLFFVYYMAGKYAISDAVSVFQASVF